MGYGGSVKTLQLFGNQISYCIVRLHFWTRNFCTHEMLGFPDYQVTDYRVKERNMPNF